MTKEMKKNKKAFTLIELLIVIVIAALMLGLSAFGARNARESSRDDKRLADIEAIRSALSRYSSDCGTYPDSLPAGGAEFSGVLNIDCLTNNVYISEFPEDPESPAATYYYEARPVGVDPKNDYILCASLTTPPNPAHVVDECAPLNNCGRDCNVIYTN